MQPLKGLEDFVCEALLNSFPVVFYRKPPETADLFSHDTNRWFRDIASVGDGIADQVLKDYSEHVQFNTHDAILRDLALHSYPAFLNGKAQIF
jgi:hypothetical protein